MNKILFAALLLFSFSNAQDKVAMCPVGNEPADSTVFVMHNGSPVYFCCEGCIPEFKADPEKFINNQATKDNEGLSTEGEIVFEVFGMDCPGCHGGVEKLILRIDGVESAKANYLTKQVSLTLSKDAELDVKALKKAVEEANFTLGKRL